MASELETVEAAQLLRALLFQALMPEEEPASCGGCLAMVAYAATLRKVSPPSAGSDLCPWHSGREAGRWKLSEEIREMLDDRR